MSPAVMLSDTHMEMTTFYNCSVQKAQEDSRVTDVMENIGSFNLNLWILFFLFLLIFMVLIFLHHRSHRDPRHSTLGHGLWTVIIYCLEKDSMHEVNHLSKLIAFLLCLFIFLMWTTFKNLMSTELITVKEPFVARSYDDITNQEGHEPVWLKTLNQYHLFKDSDDGTPAKNLWQKAETIGLDKCLMSFDMEAPEKMIASLIEKGTRLKMTFILNHMSTQPFRIAACILLAKNGICSFRSSDPKEPFQQFGGLVGRKDFILI